MAEPFDSQQGEWWKQPQGQPPTPAKTGQQKRHEAVQNFFNSPTFVGNAPSQQQFERQQRDAAQRNDPRNNISIQHAALRQTFIDLGVMQKTDAFPPNVTVDPQTGRMKRTDVPGTKWITNLSDLNNAYLDYVKEYPALQERISLDDSVAQYVADNPMPSRDPKQVTNNAVQNTLGPSGNSPLPIIGQKRRSVQTNVPLGEMNLPLPRSIFGAGATATPQRPQVDIPAVSEFARRFLDAQARGLKPGDSRFRQVSSNTVKAMAQPAQQYADARNVANGVPATATTPGVPQTGTGVSNNGIPLDDKWLLDIPDTTMQSAISNPQEAAKLVLSKNKISANSDFGKRFIQNAGAYVNQYMTLVRDQPGRLASDGSSFLPYLQGILEAGFAPAGSPETAANHQQMAQASQENLQTYFNETKNRDADGNIVNPSALTANLEGAINEAESDDDYQSTAATALWQNLFYPMMLASNRQMYASTAYDLLNQEYDKWRQGQFEGRFAMPFVDYLRDNSNYLSNFIF